MCNARKNICTELKCYVRAYSINFFAKYDSTCCIRNSRRGNIRVGFTKNLIEKFHCNICVML